VSLELVVVVVVVCVCVCVGVFVCHTVLWTHQVAV
jgi:hypothetical protein